MESFNIDIPQVVLDDLQTRIAQTRWPDQVKDAGWDYGTDISYLKEILEYWQNAFDWRKQERILNSQPQFLAEIEGLKIHFVHVHGKGPGPLPLVISHGWPSSFFEAYKIIEPLTDRKSVV